MYAFILPFPVTVLLDPQTMYYSSKDFCMYVHVYIVHMI